MWEYHASSQYGNEIHASSFPVVLHGNNLLVVFGGTGIPFGESNGNGVHVCNVKYKMGFAQLSGGKKPSRIYGQVPIYGQSCGGWVCSGSFVPGTTSEYLYYHQLFKQKIKSIVTIWIQFQCEVLNLVAYFFPFFYPLFFLFFSLLQLFRINDLNLYGSFLNVRTSLTLSERLGYIYN